MVGRRTLRRQQSALYECTFSAPLTSCPVDVECWICYDHVNAGSFGNGRDGSTKSPSLIFCGRAMLGCYQGRITCTCAITVVKC